MFPVRYYHELGMLQLLLYPSLRPMAVPHVGMAARDLSVPAPPPVAANAQRTNRRVTQVGILRVHASVLYLLGSGILSSKPFDHHITRLVAIKSTRLGGQLSSQRDQAIQEQHVCAIIAPTSPTHVVWRLMESCTRQRASGSGRCCRRAAVLTAIERVGSWCSWEVAVSASLSLSLSQSSLANILHVYK